MRSIPVAAARSLAPDRLLALPLSSTAHPCAPARSSALCCTLARPPARRHGGGTLGAQMFLAIPSSSPPLPFSPFSGTRDGRSPRSLSAFFVSPRITTGKTARKMHLLCKHVAVTREDGWKEELVTHSGAIQLRESRSLALSHSRAP